MRCKVKCGTEFEVEVVISEDKKDAIDLIKVTACVFFAVTMLVIGLAAYGAVEGNFTAYEKTLDTIVKLVELLAYGR